MIACELRPLPDLARFLVVLFQVTSKGVGRIHAFERQTVVLQVGRGGNSRTTGRVRVFLVGREREFQVTYRKGLWVFL